MKHNLIGVCFPRFQGLAVFFQIRIHTSRFFHRRLESAIFELVAGAFAWDMKLPLGGFGATSKGGE